MKKTLIGLCLVASTFVTLQAQDHTISTAVPWLNEAPDARSSALGSTGVATEADLSSQYWNVAKYAFLDNLYGISLNYTPVTLSKEATQAYLSGFYKFNRHSFSGSFRYNSPGKANLRDDENNPLGENRVNEFAIDLGYGIQLSPKWSLGFLLRYVYSNYGTAYPGSKAGQAVAADFGVYHQTDATLFGQNIQYGLGLALSNIGTKISYEDGKSGAFLPMNIRIGGRIGTYVAPAHHLALSLDLNKLMVPENDSTASVLGGMFSSFSDSPDGFVGELKQIAISTGLEYTYNKMLMARVGYVTEGSSSGAYQYLTTGLGLAYKNVTLDLSYLINVSSTQNKLNDVLRITLGFRMGGKNKQAQFIN